MSEVRAYYNEIEPFAADWLRRLIAAGLIAPGDVDTRDIRDVRPDDLRGYRQCHFFAGIGVWSHALRGAGWPDDREVYTGSCPCQPFSAAGRLAGFADERHLWPSWLHLLRERRPADVLGEQVASSAVDPWVELVHDDLEALGYAFGTIPFPAAGVGAPHIRDRCYWGAGLVADSGSQGRRQVGADVRGRGERGASQGLGQRPVHGGAEQLGDPESVRCDSRSRPRASGYGEAAVGSCNPSLAGELAYADRGGQRQRHELGRDASQSGEQAPRRHDAGRCGAVNGFWAGAEWTPCRDGKARPVEPGTFPLAHGIAGRVGRLRAYGNAIVAPAAQAWIETWMSARAIGPAVNPESPL